MSDQNRDVRIDLSHPGRTLVHLAGFYGDGGENEGVLAVGAVLDASPHYPESGRIIVGSPSTSPLVEGYIPSLGGFSCGVFAAGQLISALQKAIDDVRNALNLPLFKVWAVDACGCWGGRVLLRTGSEEKLDNDVDFAGSTPDEVARAARARHPDHSGAVVVKNFRTNEVHTVLEDGTVLAGPPGDRTRS